MNFGNVMRPSVLIVLIVVLILLFGAKRLPDAARSLGRSLRIIKAETKGLADDDRRDDLDEKGDAQAGRQPLRDESDREAATGEVIDPPRRVRDN
jgi:sec-independent protein translocase protein TatA